MGDLLGLSIVFGVKLFIDGLHTSQFRECPLILGLKVSMNGVHVVKLRLKFKPQLHLFFVVFGVLHVLLF